VGRLPWDGISDARPLPLSRLVVLGSRFSWSDVVDVEVADDWRDVRAVDGAAFTRAISISRV
jgi:hypothetical protein